MKPIIDSLSLTQLIQNLPADIRDALGSALRDAHCQTTTLEEMRRFPGPRQGVCILAKLGHKIEAIRYYRMDNSVNGTVTVGLREAKDIIEFYVANSYDHTDSRAKDRTDRIMTAFLRAIASWESVTY